jgi:hypothetical protein
MTRRSFANDRFVPIAEIAESLRKSVKHLREIGMAQNGRFLRPRFSQSCLRSYPPIVLGPGRKWGAWLSALEEWREDSR